MGGGGAWVSVFIYNESKYKIFFFGGGGGGGQGGTRVGDFFCKESILQRIQI